MSKNRRKATAIVMALLALAIAAAALTGCTTIPTVSEDELEAIEGLHTQVLPEYREYVESDPDLDDLSKSIRLESADQLESLIDTYKANVREYMAEEGEEEGEEP